MKIFAIFKLIYVFSFTFAYNTDTSFSHTGVFNLTPVAVCAVCTHQVTKREEESSLMQLKEEFRSYEALRREHDAQIVQIATEAGLRISPEQWSSLLYGDTSHKSHMQSIIDKVGTSVRTALSHLCSVLEQKFKV